MRKQFVKTKNALTFLGAFQALEQRGAGEACLMLVEGEPGTGKTTTVQWWAVQSRCVFLRAKAEWRPAWFLRELLTELRREPAATFEKMFAQALSALADAADAARDAGRPFAVVIDEADHIVGNKRLLESLRDLSDMLEVPIILVGMGTVDKALTRFPQVRSRIGQKVVFARTDAADTATLVEQLCEVPVAGALVDALHTLTLGRSRELKEALAAIERVGKRNPGLEIAPEHMAGVTLFSDRSTGKPVALRAQPVKENA